LITEKEKGEGKENREAERKKTKLLWNNMG
jgi:hypothetical protein